MIDESKARGLQAMYDAGAVGALQALQEECAGIALRVLRCQAQGSQLFLTRERAEEIAHNASARLMEQYLKHPEFRVRRFAKYLGYRVNEELFVDPRLKQKSFEAKVVPVDGTIFDFADLSERTTVAVMTEDAAQDLAESHEWGKKAVADLCRSRSYRQAIRRIAGYVGKRWIYDHAESLHEVYRALHWRAGENGGVSRSGLSAVRKSLLQGKRDQREQAHK